MTPRAVVAVVLAALAALAAMLLTTAPAAAHAALKASSPADGARIATAPERVVLTFNQDVQQLFSALTVTGPDGAGYVSGEPTAQGRDLSIAVNGLGPAGTYTVGFRVVSADGHPISGQYTFELTQSATPTTATHASTTSAAAAATADNSKGDNGFPAWPIAAAAIAVLAVVIAVTWRRRQRNH